MASLARFGFLLLVLAIVAKAQLQESDNFKNLEELSQRILAIQLQSTDHSLDTIVKSRLKTKRSNQEDDNLGKYKEDMVAAINEKRFAFAEEEMLKKNYPVALVEIVDDVYQNAGNKPHLLIEFTLSLKDKTLRQALMINLLNLSGINTEADTLQAITFVRAISEVIGNVNPIPESFERLFEIVVQRVIRDLARIIQKKGVYNSWNKQSSDLTTAIAGLRDVPKRVMVGLVDKVFVSIYTSRCFDAIEANEDPWQVLYGFEAILEKFQKANNFDDYFAIRIAGILDEMSRESNDSRLMRAAKYLLKKLPKCIFNMFDLQTFCIWNRHEDVYITCSEYKIEGSDEDVWPILGTPRSEINSYSYDDIEWEVRHIWDQDSVFFANPNKGSVVMVLDTTEGAAKDYPTTDLTAYRVLGYSSPGDNSFEGFFIEPEGSQFYLKTANNDYVVASDEYWEGSPYKTILLKPNEKSASSLWEIKRCFPQKGE